jgi:hypothetical protein
MSLNLNKCQNISFLKKKTINILTFNYKLSNHVLLHCFLLKDLGIPFDSKLLSTDHIIFKKNKALSMLSFIIRKCSNFNDPFILKCLYTSFVRYHFEYVSIIWDTQNINFYSILIESVQNRVLRFICIKCHILRYSHFGFRKYFKLIKPKFYSRKKKCLIYKIFNYISKHYWPFSVKPNNFNINFHSKKSKVISNSKFFT